MYILSLLDDNDLPFFLQTFEILPALISNSIPAFLIEINLFSFPVSIQVEIIGLLLLFSLFCLGVSICNFFILLSDLFYYQT